MKHGKKPTLEQKRLMQNWKLDPAEWLVTKNLSNRLELVNKNTGKKKIIGK